MGDYVKRETSVANEKFLLYFVLNCRIEILRTKKKEKLYKLDILARILEYLISLSSSPLFLYRLHELSMMCYQSDMLQKKVQEHETNIDQIRCQSGIPRTSKYETFKF